MDPGTILPPACVLRFTVGGVILPTSRQWHPIGGSVPCSMESFVCNLEIVHILGPPPNWGGGGGTPSNTKCFEAFVELFVRILKRSSSFLGEF